MEPSQSKPISPAMTFQVRNLQHLAPNGPANPYPRLLAKSLVQEGLAFSGTNAPHCDILHVHWLHLEIYRWNEAHKKFKIRFKNLASFTATLLLRKALGKANVCTMHNLQSHDNRFPLVERIISGLWLKLFDGLIVHSRAAKQIVLSTYPNTRPEQLHLMPHPGFVGFYPDTISKSEARKKLGLSPENHVFLAFGAIRAYKGLEDLISAFNRITNENARLIIAGKPHHDAGESDHLQVLCTRFPRIKLFLSFVPDAEVEIYFRASDVAVFPYKDILTSGGIRLAQSFGLPCLGNDLPVVRETLATCGGYLCDTGDLNALAAVLSQTITEQNTLGERGEKHLAALANNTWEAAARKTRKLYLDILSRKKHTATRAVINAVVRMISPGRLVS